MLHRIINWTKVFTTAAMVAIVFSSTSVFTNASQNVDEFIEPSKFINVKSNLPRDLESRNNAIENILSMPNIPFIDLSKANIIDDDVEAIAKGLAIRDLNEGNLIRAEIFRYKQ